MVAAVEEGQDALGVVGAAQDAVELGDGVEVVAAAQVAVDLLAYRLGARVPFGPALEGADLGDDDALARRVDLRGDLAVAGDQVLGGDPGVGLDVVDALEEEAGTDARLGEDIASQAVQGALAGVLQAARSTVENA